MESAEKLQAFYEKNRRMPTYAEVMKIYGYKSKAAAAYLINKFISQDVIGKDRRGKLIPKNMFGTVSLLGYVEAGFPAPAEETLVDTMSLDEFLITNREATFMLKVKGDSMIDAGIMDGDMVLVERGAEPHSGDIVIGNLDGQYTMKYFRQKGGKSWLEAANKRYGPMYPQESLNVEAIVRAVIRRY